ncbi:cytochrome P450 [Streptomyces sp. ME19-01-6]|uniref:cytochrome P450 n=1 Tax=Streptomyces sp. ME19-01-6 TaxID=3028686 RepID=UPI0029BD9655|nr:cytochrome P450 [Streptomyces sp. ME19-01-6]MDX3229935.1 cytochrome P450 [Streptomyces sp. ME19-01-6]
MAALEPLIRRYAVEHIETLLAAGEADVNPTLCRHVSAQALAALLNLPEEAARELLDHWQTVLDTEYDVEKFNDVMFGVSAQYAGVVVAQRRAAPLAPDDDMISGTLATEINGTKLTDDQVIKIAIATIAAGHFTTAETLGSAIHRVATVPGLQETLRSRPDLIPTAVEEMISLALPLHELGRMAAPDVELHGRTIPRGCPVGLNFAAANRDPEAFDNPDEFVLDRSQNRHLGFGHGVHKCVGAPLARLEMRVMLEEILARTTSTEPDGEPQNDVGLLGGGFERAPVRLRSAADHDN